MRTLIAAAACFLFQDTAPTTVKDLSWLVGRWTGMVDGAPTDTFGFTATTDGNFITMNVDVKYGEKTLVDRHIYGYDPEKKALTKWSFGADGSVGRSVLTAASKKDELIWEGTYGSATTPAAEARITHKRIDADNLEVTFTKNKKSFVLKFKRLVIDRSTPQAVVAAAVEAMKTPDVAALHALMTPGCVAREKEWKKSFSNALTTKGIKLVKAEIREPQIDGEKATVSVGAVFKAGDVEDGEGLNFALEKKDGAWWISELK